MTEGQGATVHQGGGPPDRWEPVRFEACPAGKRVIDVNHRTREVSWRCEVCKRPHKLTVGHPQ